MAPLGMVDTLGGFSSLEVGIVSLVVFLVLSITMVALCARCRRSSGNAYDVSGTTTIGAGASTVATGTKTAEADVSDGDTTGVSGWRSHNNMPPSTLERH